MLDTIPSAATSGVGLPEILRPLAPDIHFLWKMNVLIRDRKRIYYNPLCQSVPQGTPFFFGVHCFLFLIPICTPFLAYRFATVNRNSFRSEYKGRSLMLPHFVQSAYHLNPCIRIESRSCRFTQTR